MRWRLVVALLVCSARAFASASVPANQKEERALVIWDETKKVEHLVLEPVFATKASDVVLVVPTPTAPEVKAAHGWASLDAMFDQAPEPPPARAEDKLEAESFAASDAALARWLQRYKLDADASVREWAKGYAAKKWTLTGIHFGQPKAPVVRLTVTTDAPFFPYSRPRGAQGSTSLSLWVIARKPMQPTLAGRTTGQQQRAARVPQASLATALGDTWFDTRAEETWVVTSVRDVSFARTSAEDWLLTGYDIPPAPPGFGLEGYAPPKAPVAQPIAPRGEVKVARESPWRRRARPTALAALVLLILLFALRESGDA